LQTDPENLVYRRYLGEDLEIRAVALIARGDHVRAADVAEELPRLLPADPRCHIYAASFLVQCAAAARDTALAEPQRQALATAYESRAIQVLTQAVARRVIQGVDKLDIPELAPLRTRADFQELLNALKVVPVGS
jgi:hypothetical protein